MNPINIKRTLELVWVKANLNLRSEASVNYLSYAWWIIDPLLQMTVYYIVFSVLLNRGGENYVAFLLTGLIPWLWFSKTVTHAQGSILAGKSLINQVYIQKIFFPLTSVFQNTAKQTIVFLILLVFLTFFGNGISIYWVYIFPILVIQLLIIVGFSLICSVIVPYIRDMAFIIPTILQFMMFCSGIFFNYKDIPERLHVYFFINPMSGVLTSYRAVLLEHQSPSIYLLSYLILVGLLLTMIGFYCIRKFEYSLPRVVLE